MFLFRHNTFSPPVIKLESEIISLEASSSFIAFLKSWDYGSAIERKLASDAPVVGELTIPDGVQIVWRTIKLNKEEQAILFNDYFSYIVRKGMDAVEACQHG